jgi:hypothetical protein
MDLEDSMSGWRKIPNNLRALERDNKFKDAWIANLGPKTGLRFREKGIRRSGEPLPTHGPVRVIYHRPD